MRPCWVTFWGDGRSLGAGAQIARTRLPGWLSEFVLACVGLREYVALMSALTGGLRE